MTNQKKIANIINMAKTEDLSEYKKVLKIMKKELPLFVATERVALALLKEYLGDIRNFDISPDEFSSKGKKAVFEDIKDGKARIFVNIGKNHRIQPGDLIREIVKRSGIDGKLIGRIDIHQSYSFIEIPEQYAEIVLLSFDDVKIRGVKVVMEPAKKKKDI